MHGPMIVKVLRHVNGSPIGQTEVLHSRSQILIAIFINSKLRSARKLYEAK
jgi:uncharacterized membrane protein AbrB (regulator of aidB expression)